MIPNVRSTGRVVTAVGAALFIAGFSLLIIEFFVWAKTGEMRAAIPWLYWREAGVPASIWVTVAGGLLAVAGAIVSES